MGTAKDRRATAAAFARHMHRPLQLSNDTVHDRQAQASALLPVACREKRIENPAERVLVHTLAGIAHDQLT